MYFKVFSCFVIWGLSAKAENIPQGLPLVKKHQNRDLIRSGLKDALLPNDSGIFVSPTVEGQISIYTSNSAQL